MKKLEALSEALDIVCTENRKIFTSVFARTKKDINREKFLSVISKESYNLAKELEINSQLTSRLLKTLFPERVTSTTGNKPCTYILNTVGLKYCTRCSLVKEKEDFRDNKANINGLNSYCRVCHLETTAITQSNRQSKYRAAKINRIMSWSELEEITKFYKNCPSGYHVDHILPLNGSKVSGLHVLNNLQYLTAKENCSKNNKYETPNNIINYVSTNCKEFS